MKRYVALLRGINVSGQKIIKMEALKGMFEIPGFKNVVTYIQSGNVLFDTKEADADVLRTKIEKMLHKSLGYEVVTIVRSVDEIKSVLEANPFREIGGDDERKQYIHFLSSVPDAALFPLLDKVLIEGEEFKVLNKELYMITPGYGNSKLSNAVIEKKLGVSSTARNLNTVNKVTTL